MSGKQDYIVEIHVVAHVDNAAAAERIGDEVIRAANKRAKVKLAYLVDIRGEDD